MNNKAPAGVSSYLHHILTCLRDYYTCDLNETENYKKKVMSDIALSDFLAFSVLNITSNSRLTLVSALN